MNWKEEWKLHNGEGEVPKWFSELIMSMEESYAHSTENGYCCACPYDIACLEEEVKRSQQQLLERLSEGVKKDKKAIPSNEDELIVPGVTDQVIGYNSALNKFQALIQEEISKI